MHDYGDSGDSNDSSTETLDSNNEEKQGMNDGSQDDLLGVTPAENPNPEQNTPKKELSVSQEPSEPSPLSPETFWSVYNGLEEKERHDPSNMSEVDKNTVNGTEIISRLYETGQCSKAEAREYLDRLVQFNELEMVMDDTYRRRFLTTFLGIF